MNLHEKWAELNASCFDGELWPCEITVSPNTEWTSETWGGCFHAPQNRVAIWLWDEIDPELLEATLAHEMIHQWQRQHGYPMHHNKQFRRKAKLVFERTGLQA